MAIATLTTLALSSDASVGTLSLVLKSDGSYEFTDAEGVVVTTHSNEAMRRLFEALAELV